ncbi:NifU family protein [Aquifex aeolicus]|uniref:NifU family protein n=1 Tax=Aquifex aeolicus TaxID=63363 RepID=UPI0013E8DFB0|nr:NifU family protein [Aquifex aeolicus]
MAEMKKVEEIEKVLEKIRPALKEHQGELKLVDIKEDTVYLSFEGGCSSCPVVDISLKNLVDTVIKGNVKWVKKVEITQQKFDIQQFA